VIGWLVFSVRESQMWSECQSDIEKGRDLHGEHVGERSCRMNRIAVVER